MYIYNFFKGFAMKIVKYISLLLVFISLNTKLVAAEKESYYKKIQYETSLHFTLLVGYEWWSKIEPYNLYLGGLPLNDQNHLEQIKSLGVSRVISIVENFELEDGWWHQPVKHAEWVIHNIGVKQISVADLCPLTSKEIEEGIETLTRFLDEGHTVYIHCKAGVGRSASIVVAFVMKQHQLSLEDALAFVKERRWQIHLNSAQRKAVADYFNSKIEEKEDIAASEESFFVQAQAITEENLSTVLNEMLNYAIEGGTYEANQYPMPEFMSGWSPNVQIESTLSRRNRYLRQYKGDQDCAVQAAIEKNHSLYRKWQSTLTGIIPFIGAPTNYTITLWHQMREVALIASIYGHEMNEATRIRILESLVQGNAMKIPAQTLDVVVKQIIKSILLQAGLKSIPGVSLPAHILFNYFTDNAAKVSTYAIEAFGGTNALPVSPAQYSE